MAREDRVFGPPGTGKTTWLSRQVQNAVTKHGSHSVIVASFTRAAAAELAGRDLPLEKDQIGTLHAHCFRALDRPKIADTLIKDFNQENPALSLSEENQNRLDEGAQDQFYKTEADALAGKYQILRAKMTDRSLWPDEVQAFARIWEGFKRETGTLDFTDLIEVSLQDVDAAPGSPSIGFFDEVQDFTPLELALVRKWGQKMDHILLAGDDDQCIYAFKGSSPVAFLDPPVPDDQKRVLRQSYRVPKKVQTVAQRWVEQLSRREPKEYAPRDVEGEVRTCPATWKNVEPALMDAQRYLEEGKSVMFLGACSYMLDPLKQILRRDGIPFHNPYRKTRGDWNPLSGGGGVSASERILAYLRPDVSTWGDFARMWSPDDLRKWVEIVKAQGLLRRGAKSSIDGFPSGPALEIEDLLNFFEEQGLAGALSISLDWLEQNLLDTRKRVMEYPLGIARKFGPARLRQRPQIILGTIHSVKGGEADAVYLFPDLSMSGMREWIRPGEDRDSIIRQFYVGMTRAKESLIICGAASPARVELGAIA